MPDKFKFFFYIVGLGIILSSHNIFFLSIFSLFLFILSYKKIFKLLKKSLKSIISFNLTISLGFILVSTLKDQPWLDFIMLFNLRVFDLSFMTILFAQSVNLSSLLRFSPTLSFLFTVSLSQITSYQKSYENFLLSLKSRLIKKMGERRKKEFIGAVFGYFFKKALYDSSEKSLALKARGFFDKS